MPNRIILWPYKLGSKGCKNLQDKLKEVAPASRPMRVRSDGNYRPFPNHFIVNWGNGGSDSLLIQRFAASREQNMLNWTDAVAKASNKLSTFKCLAEAGVSIPKFFTSVLEAEEFMMENEGLKVYCRTKLTGHSGVGIVVASALDDLVDAPLYTAGINNCGEFRVHVFKGEVIDVTKKRRRTADDGSIPETTSGDIRNLDNGWVFCRGNVTPPESVVEHAVKAIEALGLDFGAVDVVYGRQTMNPREEKKAYVLEINSAPGLEGETVNKYAEAICRLLT